MPKEMSIVSNIHLTGRGLFLIITLSMAFILMDVFLIKFYDTIDKNMIPLMVKKIIFSVVSFLCVILQLIVLRYLKQLTLKTKISKIINVELISKIVHVSQYSLMVLLAFMIFQLFYLNYYSSLLLILFVAITYGIASILILKTAMSFISWYKLNHNFIFLIYSISFGLIAFNLILTSITVDKILSEKPVQIREFAGGSMDISGGKYKLLSNLVKISSIMSFIGIWFTTALLMYTTTEKIIKKVRYWIILSTPLVYFLLGYFVQDIFGTVLFSYFSSNPILIALTLSSIFILSKPVGGLIFGLLFWRISRLVRSDRTLREYMIVSGYGFLLLFSANQASLLALGPYPPFGLVTILFMVIGSYLVFTGISNSAVLIARDKVLRKEFYRNAMRQLDLLGAIGVAQMEKEIIKNYKSIEKRIKQPEMRDRRFEKDNAREVLHGLVDDMDKDKVREILHDVLSEVYSKSKAKSDS
jgi:hypothetical protein